MSDKFNKQEVAFIEALRKEKSWTFSGLVVELQKIAKADIAKRSLAAEAPTSEYITRVLRGQRAANENWRLWIASVFGLTLDQFTQRRSLIGKLKSGGNLPFSKPAVLPINYWPHMKWSSAVTSERQIAAKIYGLSKHGLKALFNRVPGEWKTPDGFDGYPQLRQLAWEQFTANFQRMKKEPPNPEPLWHVSRLHMADESTVAMDLQLTDYQDVLITGSLQGLNKAIRVEDGRTITVQEWLAEQWKAGDVSQPIIPCARQLVVNILVLTKDREVVIGLQGPDNPDSNGSWVTGVSRLVYPKTDSDSYGIPSLEKAASGGCIRELGIPISGKQVKWVALAAGLKLGSFAFFGVVETEYDRDQVLKMFQENRRTYVKHNLGHEVIDIDFVKIEANAVAERLKTENFRPYMELGLALLLWLNGKAEIKAD